MKNSLKSFLVLVIVSLSGAATGASLSSQKAPSPRIDSISGLTLERAGRLRIFGVNFGAIKGGSQVLIDGVPAPVSRWSDTLVVAYVPEAAQLATVPLQLVTIAGPSNKLQLDVKASNLDVTAPEVNGSIRWRFEVDGDYMEFRPTIGPDGTIYFQDVDGHLYALRADGSVKWIFQGGYPAGPVAVGADNTTYIASGGTIQAISPAGTLVWQFTDPDSQVVIGGPAVGPDGKVYAAMDLLGLGAIALSPVDGHLVWSNPGDPRLAEYGQSGLELVFGPAFPGAQPDQFYFTCDNYTTSPQGHLYAFSLNGDQRWAVPAGGTGQVQVAVAVAPNGTISQGVAAYNPSNGSLRWSAYSALGSGSDLPTNIGPDGTVYVLAQYQSALAALNGQNGAVLWRVTGVGFEQGPVVSPLNDVVVVGGRDNYGLPGSFKAFSTGGQSLWQIDLPGEPYPGTFEFPFNQGRFSLDGATVYMGTDISGEPPDNLHCYLYAVQTANTQICSYLISPLSSPFTSIGGQGSVNVTSPSGCEWTATSTAAWLAITSGASGIGNGTVNYSVVPNDAAAARTGTVTVAEHTFTVTQSGTATTTTIGVYLSGNQTFYLRSSNSQGFADMTMQYGPSGAIPIVGDWDGNGTATIGVYDPSSQTFYLRNSNTPGFADLTVRYGPPGAIPIVGDWDGDGTATIGVYDPPNQTFYLRNSNSVGFADLTIRYGPPGAVPIVGDWDADGTTTIGVYDPSSQTFYLRNTNSPGFADLTVRYGPSGATPMVGDWDANGTVTIGVYDPSSQTFYLRNSNSIGFADLTIRYGPSGATPLAGDWDGN